MTGAGTRPVQRRHLEPRQPAVQMDRIRRTVPSLLRRLPVALLAQVSTNVSANSAPFGHDTMRAYSPGGSTLRRGSRYLSPGGLSWAMVPCGSRSGSTSKFIFLHEWVRVLRLRHGQRLARGLLLCEEAQAGCPWVIRPPRQISIQGQFPRTSLSLYFDPC